MPDCEHLTVTWDPYPLSFSDRLQTVHWFVCDWCSLKACVVTTDVRLNA